MIHFQRYVNPMTTLACPVYGHL